MRDAVWPTDEDAANIAADVFRKKLVSQRLCQLGDPLDRTPLRTFSAALAFTHSSVSPPFFGNLSCRPPRAFSPHKAPKECRRLFQPHELFRIVSIQTQKTGSLNSSLSSSLLHILYHIKYDFARADGNFYRKFTNIPHTNGKQSVNCPLFYPFHPYSHSLHQAVQFCPACACPQQNPAEP